MAYNPQNANGQATMANSTPVVVASDQSAIPISDNGSSVTVDGSVSVSNFPATQPVSGTVTVQDGGGSLTVDGTVALDSASLSALESITVQNGAGASAVNIQDGGNSITVDGSVTVSGTVTANAGTGTMNVSVQNASIPVTDNGGSLTVDGSVSVSNFPATQAISAASLPLPSGASTSAKQPALGTAGTASSDVITVQGITGMTALKVDGSAVTQPISGSVSVSNFPATQPVSGTVTANAGSGSFTVAQATAANLNATVTGTVASTQSGTWNVGLNAGANAIGSITNTSFAATQSTAANLNATVVGTGTFAVQADTELPTAAALADATANPSTTSVGALGLGYNGTTWDRIKTGTAVDGNGAVDFTGAVLVKNAIKRVNPSNLGTATNSASTVDVNGANNVTVGIATTTTGTFIIEGTADNTNWFNVECFDIASDLWVSGTSLTPTAGKAYAILSGGLRQVRIRTNATLGATVSHFYVLDNSQAFLGGIDTGAAPHNFGYTLVHKDAEYTTAQTTVALWTPTSGKKFAVTDITISVGGTTSGIVTIYDAAASTAYSAGTTPAIFRGTFAPSATANPGVVKSFNVPYVSTTANNRLHVTTSANITVYIQVNGYEI